MSNFSPLDLRQMLPARSGLDLQLYHQLLINDFSSVGFRDPADICQDANNTSVIFSADEDDDGSIFVFQNCSNDQILFLPQENVLSKVYDRSLICIDSKSFISSFFSEFSTIRNGSFLFQAPNLVYWRKKRFRDRIHLQTKILIRRRNLQTIHGWLRDFSTTGIGFLVNDVDLPLGEIVLVEFSVPNCGDIASTARIVRRENHLNRQFGLFVAARLLLTRTQAEYMRSLYFCAQGKGLNLPDTPELSKIGSYEKKSYASLSDKRPDTARMKDAETPPPAAKTPASEQTDLGIAPLPVQAILSMATPYQPNFSPLSIENPGSSDDQVDNVSATDAVKVEEVPQAITVEPAPVEDPPSALAHAELPAISTDPDDADQEERPPLVTPPLSQSVDLSQETMMSEEQSQQASFSPVANSVTPVQPSYSSPRRLNARVELAAVLCSKAEVFIETEGYREGLESYEQALAILQDLPEADAVTPKTLDIRGRALLGKARALFSLGDSNAASSASEAIQTLAQVQQDSVLKRPRLGMDLAQAYMIRGTAASGQNPAEAIEAYQQADKILQEMRGQLADQAPLELLQLSARLALCVGNLYASEGNLTESLPHLDRAHELSELALRALPEEASWALRTTSASALLQKGNMLFQLGKEGEGKQITEESIQIWQGLRTQLADQFTSSHYAQLGIAQLQYAKFLRTLGLYSQAESTLAAVQSVLQELQQKFGDALPPHAQQLVAAVQLQESELALEQGKLSQASTSAERVITAMRSLQDRLGKQFSFEMRELLAAALLSLGKIHGASGNNKAALDAISEAQLILAS